MRVVRLFLIICQRISVFEVLAVTTLLRHSSERDGGAVLERLPVCGMWFFYEFKLFDVWLVDARCFPHWQQQTELVARSGPRCVQRLR